MSSSDSRNSAASQRSACLPVFFSGIGFPNNLFALPEFINEVEQFLRRMDIQLVINVGNVGLRGMNGNDEFSRNILRVASLGNESEDFALSL